jgi:hypothetical protein
MNFTKSYYVKPPGDIPKFLKSYSKSPEAPPVDKYDSILSLIASKLQDPEVKASPSATKYLENMRMSVNGLREEEKDGEATSYQAKTVIDGFTTQIINKRYIEGGRRKSKRRRSKHKKTRRYRK